MKHTLVAVAVAVVAALGCNTQQATVKDKDGKGFTLETPKEVSVTQDGTKEFKVSIKRKDFTDAVSISFDDLPSGVSVTEKDYKFEKDAKDHTFTLKAAGDAKVVSGHAFKVIASAGDKKATETVTINVTEKKTGAVNPKGGDDLAQKREELKTNVQKQMKDIDDAMATLGERAKVAKDDAKVNLDKDMATLRTRRDALNKDFERIGNTTAQAWNEFATGVSNAAAELRDATKKAVDKYK